MRFIVDVKISINNIAQVIPTGWKMHETKRYKEGFSNFNIQRRRRTNLWKAKTHLFWTVTYVFVAIPHTLPFSVAFLCAFPSLSSGWQNDAPGQSRARARRSGWSLFLVCDLLIDEFITAASSQSFVIARSVFLIA